jgi:hypothetical protein
MQRTIQTIPDSPYRREVTVFESHSEAEEARSITPEGSYPIAALPGYVLAVRFEEFKVCGRMVREVVKQEVAAGDAAMLSGSSAFPGLGRAGIKPSSDPVSITPETINQPIVPAVITPGLAQRLEAMSDAQREQYAVEHSVILKPKMNKREVIAAILAGAK